MLLPIPDISGYITLFSFSLKTFLYDFFLIYQPRLFKFNCNTCSKAY